MDRRLYRSRRERMLGGVCGGIAEYFQVDPTIIRLVAVVISIIGNAAPVIAYLVMWAAVPEEPAEGFAPQGHTQPEPREPVTASTPGQAPAPAAAPPSAPEVVGTAGATSPQASHGRGTMRIGLALIILGLVFVAEEFLPGIDLWQLWPLVIIGLGIRMVFLGKGD